MEKEQSKKTPKKPQSKTTTPKKPRVYNTANLKKGNPAPKGNQWWRLRTKHGRDKIFTTPEILMESAIEYFEATDQRKWNKTDFRGKDATKVLIPTDTPYTMSGLTLFLGVNEHYFNDFKDSLKDKEDSISKGFSDVIRTIEQIIYTQKYEGAVVGAFSSNIIARDLGLVDKKEIENKNIKPIEFTIIGKKNLNQESQ
ncbi:terminase small subunit [Flavobacterium sp.]|uniref:terminase small subunit n=1 Tax=Flavobacterium sp. TaxID=239 RepID=UPI0026204CE8|nr:terminase small subunit [Flavobacterium sp.]